MLLIYLLWLGIICELNCSDEGNVTAHIYRLDIFFSGMKIVGQEFHIPRFLAR